MAGILSYALSLNTSAFSGPMGQATGLMRGLAGSATSAASTIAKIAAPLAALGGGISLFKTLEKAADMESLKVSFETVLGSAKAADDMLAKITATAAATPYGIEELAQSARRLLAVTDANALVPTLRMIGDLASAAQKPITDLASMYAKIKGSDKIDGEDFNQLSDALPGSLQQFVKVLGVDSVAAVRKLGEEGRITGAALDQVFINMTTKGGMAFDGMNKQSQTTKGLMSTLNDAVSALMVTIGTPINDFLKPIITANIARLETLNIQVKAFLELLKSAKDQGQLGAFIGVSLKVALIDAVNIFASGVQGTVAFLGSALPNTFRAAVDMLTSDRSRLFFENLFKGIGELLTSVLEGAAAKFATAIGRTQLGKDWEANSERSYARAQIGLGAAAAAAKGADTAEVAQRLADTGAAILTLAKAAADAATKKPFYDNTEALAELRKLTDKLNPEASKNLFNPTPAAGDPADSKPVVAKGPVMRGKPPSEQELKHAAELAARQAEAARAFSLENNLLEARIGGHKRLITAAEQAVNLEKTKLSLMQQQGLSEDEALAKAKERLALEEKSANPRKSGTNHLDAAASAAARLARRNSADIARDFREGRDGLTQADRLGLLAKAKRDADKADRQGKVDLKKDPAALARGAAKADPAQARREAAAAAEKKAADAKKEAEPLFQMVKNIHEKLARLATA